jgi:putative hydrolase of the HAD superfamily
VIRAVTFDFWQTMADDAPDNLAAQRRLRIEALHAAVREVGLGLDFEEVEVGYERSQGLLEAQFWNAHRDPGFPEQVALVLDCVAPGAAPRVTGARWDALLRAYADPVLRLPPLLCPGAAEAVRRLAARGLPLGIVSNTGRTPGTVLRQYLERHDLLRHFRALSFSDEVGVRKPDTEIFRGTLAKLGPEARIVPPEIAHVGDNPHADVEGALGVGMRAVHYAAGGRPGSERADLVITDLATLPERLAAL